MARKATPDPAPSNAPSYRVAGPDLKGLALLFLSLITLLALFGVDIGNGRLNGLLAAALRWLLGWGAYLFALAIGGLGLLILLRRPWHRTLSWGRIVAAELALLCLLGFSTLWVNPALSWAAATAGSGGGVTGWLVGWLLAPIGNSGGLILLGLATLLLLPKVLGLSLDELQHRLDRQQQAVQRRRVHPLAAPAPSPTAPPRPARRPPPVVPAVATQVAAAKSVASPPTESSAPVGVGVIEQLKRMKEVVSQVAPKAKSAGKGKAVATAPAPVAPRQPYELPPLDLLQSHSSSQIDPHIAREKARTIEETLRHFGIPATVVQVNQGPTVTQFGVQPGFIELTKGGKTIKRKIKVSAITNLADDLALALAAKTIRVEAPVPGRPYVGIEVPNRDTEMVTLHSVLTSDDFTKMNSDLALALGRDVSGHPVAADLAKMPHLLIAGATGSGKSVCVNAIIASLLFNLPPDQLKLLMIDPKMVELIPYNGIPHLVAPVVTDMERVVGALTWAMREMDRRYKLFSEAGKRNHESYNRWAISQGKESLPYLVIIIDELADLMMVAADQVERIICRLAQMARATGIHLILATQRPSVDVVTGLIKANVPTRISFAVASSTDSRVILDANGAEALLGQGDMLYQAPDTGKLQRLQGCYVSDAELQAVVEHWLRAAPRRARAEAAQTPWDAIIDELEEEEHEEDELLGEAIAIVREHQWASTSFLQRKLRIGYTRAARLIDSLEEKEIIGPPEEGSNGSRQVLVAPLDEGE